MCGLRYITVSIMVNAREAFFYYGQACAFTMLTLLCSMGNSIENLPQIYHNNFQNDIAERSLIVTSNKLNVSQMLGKMKLRIQEATNFVGYN